MYLERAHPAFLTTLVVLAYLFRVHGSWSNWKDDVKDDLFIRKDVAERLKSIELSKDEL